MMSADSSWQNAVAMSAAGAKFKTVGCRRPAGDTEAVGSLAADFPAAGCRRRGLRF